MKEVNFKYYDDSLEELFKKEIEVLSNIGNYCEETDKLLKSEFSLSVDFENLFILEIKIIKQ